MWGLLLRDYPSKLVSMYSLSGDILRVSEQVLPILGFSGQLFEHTKLNVGAVMHRDDVSLVFQGFSDLLEGRESATVDLTHRIFSDFGRQVLLFFFFFFFFFFLSCPLGGGGVFVHSLGSTATTNIQCPP